MDARICNRFTRDHGEMSTEVRTASSKHLSSHVLILALALFAKDSSAHLKDGLETFATPLRVLTESLHARFFNFIFDLLPPTADCSYLCFLFEIGLGIRHRLGWLIYNHFPNVENI